MQPKAIPAGATFGSSFLGPDLRADGAARQVSVNRQQVSIARRFEGIEMRLAVPVAAYKGVVLRAAHPAGNLCRVTLEHPDPELSVTLCEAGGDAGTAENIWSSWAVYLQLPALREGAADQESLGGMPTARRRSSVESGRRPRFLARRRPGVCGRMAVIHKDEELISYE